MPRTKAFSGGLALLTGLALAGCSRPAPPLPNADHSRAALTRALDAWKAGEVNPVWEGRPIALRDDRVKNGVKLVAYELGEESDFGYDRRIQVRLTMLPRTGKTRKQTIAYHVRTHPAVVISLADEE